MPCRGILFSSLVVASVMGIACSSSSNNDSPATTNGVDDVVQACAIKASWTRVHTQACSDCMVAAKNVKCACSDDPNAGRCSDQSKAVATESVCTGVDTCIAACAENDCNCITACYQEPCRPLGNARDGCLTAVCDTDCR